MTTYCNGICSDLCTVLAWDLIQIGKHPQHTSIKPVNRTEINAFNPHIFCRRT